MSFIQMDIIAGSYHGEGGRAISEGVPRSTINAEDGTDLARTDFLNVLHLVAVHANEPRNLDLLARARMVDELALAHRALVDAHVRQLAEAALLELERERDERGGRRGSELDGRGGDGGRGVVGGDLVLGGLGQVRADAAEEGLHGGVLDRRAEEDGGELEAGGRAADGVGELRP